MLHIVHVNKRTKYLYIVTGCLSKPMFTLRYSIVIYHLDMALPDIISRVYKLCKYNVLSTKRLHKTGLYPETLTVL